MNLACVNQTHWAECVFLSIIWPLQNLLNFFFLLQLHFPKLHHLIYHRSHIFSLIRDPAIKQNLSQPSLDLMDFELLEQIGEFRNQNL